jgi:hypothetical protein
MVGLMVHVVKHANVVLSQERISTTKLTEVYTVPYIILLSQET